MKMTSRSIDLISKKTNYTCSILFFLNNKKQICTCSTLFVFLCRYFAQLQRCFAGLRLRANVVAPTMLGVVACVLAVVCKRMQQLPTSLGPTVHRGKNTTHKSLKSMRNECAWPQQCWKSFANGSNIVALRFGDHGTKEMLGVVG